MVLEAGTVEVTVDLWAEVVAMEEWEVSQLFSSGISFSSEVRKSCVFVVPHSIRNGGRRSSKYGFRVNTCRISQLGSQDMIDRLID